jgi:hypothetical protein
LFKVKRNEKPSWIILALGLVVDSTGIKTKEKIDQLTYGNCQSSFTRGTGTAVLGKPLKYQYLSLFTS